MPPKTFNIGVKGLIKIDNKVLLLMRKDGFNKSYWDIPGGRMGEGEEILQTLERELTEEIPSIKKIQIGDLIHIYKFERNLKDGN